MSFTYNMPKAPAPLPPTPAPWEPVPQDENDGDNRIREVFTYKVKGKDVLTFVWVESVDVDGDEVGLSKRVESYDESVEHVIYDEMEDTVNVTDRADEWKRVSWDELTECDGDTFTAHWEDSTLDRWDAVWTCRATLPDAYHALNNATSLTEADLTFFAQRMLLVSRYSDYPAAVKAMTRALTGHLQRCSSTFVTPGDADACAHMFFDEVAKMVVTMRRNAYAPSMYRLVSAAVDDAKPTPTGLDSLDGIIGGGLVPGVYVVAGDPGAGKTALAVQTLLFVAHQCAEDEVAVYAMLDQGGSAEVAKRLVSLAWAIKSEAGGEGDRRLLLPDAGQWDEESQGAGIDAFSDLSKNRAVLFDQQDGSFPQLRHKLDELQKNARVSVRLLVIDYYQLLRDVNPVYHGDDYEVTGASVASDAAYASSMMRELRTWATSHGAPVLLVGQFSKESIQRHAKGAKPEMTDLLGSVDVPYQAESVIMLTNAHDGSGVVELADVKHRHAGNEAQGGRVARMRLDGERGYFRELDE